MRSSEFAAVLCVCTLSEPSMLRQYGCLKYNDTDMIIAEMLADYVTGKK